MTNPHFSAFLWREEEEKKRKLHELVGYRLLRWVRGVYVEYAERWFSFERYFYSSGRPPF